jgi:hypothetical protein
MELWIPVTVFAAFMQNARSALQRHLKGRLTTMGATYVRFLYAAPFAIAYMAGLHLIGGAALPSVNGTFLVYVVLGGLSQILFTFLLLWLFSFRNVAAGTTFSNTEVGQNAILGVLVLGGPAGRRSWLQRWVYWCCQRRRAILPPPRCLPAWARSPH